jgi:hypothetical protein
MSPPLHSGLTVVTDWQECYDTAVNLISGGAPLFLGRVGGSDTDAVVDYLAARNEGTADAFQHVTDRHLARVMKFNGFYDLDRSPEKTFRYLHLLLECYEQCPRFALVGRQLLNMYFPDNLNPAFRDETLQDADRFVRLIDGIVNRHNQVICFPYPFYEKLVFDRLTLFRAFSTTLPGKRVLVVSPFSESIEANFGNRAAFFRDYEYPEFDLLTLATPITYSDLPKEYYPHSDWFETTAALKGELRKIEFDIALLACGSYAVPLGLFIEQELRRQAIYVGGVLQLFFGIMGRRYDNPFFLDQINPDKFIFPVERAKYLGHVTVKHDTPRDAFGAYF